MVGTSVGLLEGTSCQALKYGFLNAKECVIYRRLQTTDLFL